MRSSLLNHHRGALATILFLACPVCRPRSQNGEPVAGAGGLLTQSATFEVLTESQVYVDILSITRLPLLALTVRKPPPGLCRCACVVFCTYHHPFLWSSIFSVQQLELWATRAIAIPYGTRYALPAACLCSYLVGLWHTAFAIRAAINVDRTCTLSLASPSGWGSTTNSRSDSKVVCLRSAGAGCAFEEVKRLQ